MSSITRILQQQKDKERVNLYLDGKFAFGVTLESVIQNNLKVGQELTAEKIDELKSDGDVGKVLNRALSYAMSRPHSEREIMLWFRRRKVVDEVVIEKVLAKLKRLNIINDLNFVKWWVEQRNTFRPKGKNALKAELAQKGVHREIIDEVLKDTDRGAEQEMARQIAKKRLPRLANLDMQDQKRKLLEFLARRGFSYDVAKSVIDEMMKKE